MTVTHLKTCPRCGRPQPCDYIDENMTVRREGVRYKIIRYHCRVCHLVFFEAKEYPERPKSIFDEEGDGDD
jgi:hypothetical protein